MGRAAGVITLRMKAGTAELFTDIDKAKAKVREFGATSKASNAEVAATVKALEGNFAGTTRAVSRFLGTTLGLGPVIAAAFPVVGAVLLGKAVVDTAEKVRDFFKGIREAPEKVKGAFRDLNSSLRTSNDELAVTNARLENDIDKLEGRRQNTLKLALAEARVEADKLADALDKDIDRLFKLLSENDVGMLRRLGGEAGTEYIKKFFGGETGVGGFRGEIDRISDEGTAAMGRATTAKEKDAAQTQMNTRLMEAYARALQQVDRWMAAAQERGQSHTVTAFDPTTGRPFQRVDAGKNVTVELEELAGARRAIAGSMAGIAARSTTGALTDRKNQLEGEKAAGELTKPYREKLAALNAELDAAGAKLGAEGSVLMKAYAEAVKAIADVNRALEEHHRVLSEDEAQEIKGLTVSIQRANAEAEWKTKLADSTAAIRDRVRGQEMLSAAIGKGAEAERRARLEIAVMGAVGAERYNDPRWMAAHAGDVAGLRSGIQAQMEAERATATGEAVYGLEQEIRAQNLLTEAQKVGEEEIRRLGALAIWRTGIEKGLTGQQIAGEVALYYAKIRTQTAAGVAKIDAERNATEKLIDVQMQGAEAIRRQNLENKYAEMQRTGRGGEVGAERTADDVARQLEITAQVAGRVNLYTDEMEKLDRERDALLKIIGAHKATAEQARALRDLQRERLSLWVREQLAIGTIRAGVRAFFADMQASAKRPGEIFYESMHSAVDRVSDELAKLLTGDQTSFGAMLKGLGQDTLRSAIKAGAEQGLGALGRVFGIKMPEGKPDGTKAKPIHVVVDNAGGGGGSAADPVAAVGAAGAAAAGSPWLADLLGSIFTPRAGGGDVVAGRPYLVGEQGSEILVPGMSGAVLSHALAQRAFSGGGSSSSVYVDARGAELGAEQRLYRAAGQLQRSAVATSVQAMHERGRRTPQRMGS